MSSARTSCSRGACCGRIAATHRRRRVGDERHAVVFPGARELLRVDPGIRLALGSDPRGIVRLVLSEGALLLAVGIAGGVAGALALRDVIASELYGIGALDPAVMLTAVAILGFVSLIACLGPARRAARVSALVALSEH